MDFYLFSGWVRNIILYHLLNFQRNYSKHFSCKNLMIFEVAAIMLHVKRASQFGRKRWRKNYRYRMVLLRNNAVMW